MATRKTTTRGKTKTAKTVKKTPAKASAARTRQKTVSAPAKTTKSKTAGKSASDKRLKLFNSINAAFAVLGIGAVALFMRAVELPLSIGYVTRNILTSVEQTDFVPAERVLVEIDIRWILIALLILLGVYSVLLVTRWQKNYAKALANRVFGWRWLFTALTGSLSVSLAALLSGIESLYLIKLMVAAVLLSAGLSWLAERQNNSGDKTANTSFVLAVASGLVPWLVIGGQLLSTQLYGMVRLPWFAYAAVAASLLGSLLTGLNQWRWYRGQGKWQNYNFVERNYLAIELASKLSLVTVLVYAFR